MACKIRAGGVLPFCSVYIIRNMTFSFLEIGGHVKFALGVYYLCTMLWL
jgi:hypothetical protein